MIINYELNTQRNKKVLNSYYNKVYNMNVYCILVYL